MALLGCVLSAGRLQVSTLFLYIFCLFGIYICFLFRLQVQNVEWFMFLNSRNIIILGFVVILYFIDLSSYQHYFILFLWVYSSLALCFFNFLSGMLSCLFSNLLVHQKIHHNLIWEMVHCCCIEKEKMTLRNNLKKIVSSWGTTYQAFSSFQFASNAEWSQNGRHWVLQQLVV